MEEHNINIDLMRCVACVAVVAIHVVAVFWYSTPISLLSFSEYWENFMLQQSDFIVTYKTVNWYILSFIDSVVRFSVPVFVMISGRLILNRSNLDGSYIRKKILYLIMLIFSWGGVQAAIYLVKCILAKSEFDLIKTILLIVKGPTVFWFLYMLIPLYFISPVLCEILRKQSACIYFFVAWFIGTIVVNSILSIWPSLNDVVQLNNIGLFSSYMGYYLFGAYYGKYGMNSRTKYIIYCLGILSILMMLFCEPVGFFHNFVTPFNMFWSISVFLFFDGIKLSSHRINKLLQSFSKKTLGIYAIHVYCIRLITKIWAPSVSNCILQVFFYFVFAVVASYVATMILKKIKFLKRIV